MLESDICTRERAELTSALSQYTNISIQGILMANYHVTKNPGGGWNALRENAGRASGTYDTQRQAEHEAKIFSANSGGGEVRIHGQDGKIRDSDTVAPGNDPCPPKDRVY